MQNKTWEYDDLGKDACRIAFHVGIVSSSDHKDISKLRKCSNHIYKGCLSDAIDNFVDAIKKEFNIQHANVLRKGHGVWQLILIPNQMLITFTWQSV